MFCMECGTELNDGDTVVISADEEKTIVCCSTPCSGKYDDRNPPKQGELVTRWTKRTLQFQSFRSANCVVTGANMKLKEDPPVTEVKVTLLGNVGNGTDSLDALKSFSHKLVDLTLTRPKFVELKGGKK